MVEPGEGLLTAVKNIIGKAVSMGGQELGHVQKSFTLFWACTVTRVLEFDEVDVPHGYRRADMYAGACL